MLPKIFADWNNLDPEGRVRLTNGSFEDIIRLNIKLAPGLKVVLDNAEGLAIEGIIEYSKDEKIWVGRFDPSKLE